MQQIHLLRETFPASPARCTNAALPGRAPHDFEVIEVPGGASFVTTCAQQCIRFSEDPPPPGEQVLIVEPVNSGVQTMLLIVSQFQGNAVKINGRPAPPAALAGVGDQLTLYDDLVFRILLHLCPSIGQPSAEQLGKECLVCRIPVVEGTRVYTCLNGCALHCESDDHKSGAEPLECARLVTECPACHTPINLEEGYANVPEL